MKNIDSHLYFYSENIDTEILMSLHYYRTLIPGVKLGK